jgi:CheY-like chemotaxis protein
MTIRALRKRKLTNHLLRVKDGVEALEFIFGSGAWADRPPARPKLILLDLKMPRLDGIDVLKRLKADERTKLIPIVMLTSSSEERDVIDSYRLGVNSYLVKPVDFAEFIEVVSHAGLFWAVLNRVPN